MTRGVELSTEEIDAALSSLSKKGYVEEFESGRWRLSKNGYGVRRSLLGELESTD